MVLKAAKDQKKMLKNVLPPPVEWAGDGVGTTCVFRPSTGRIHQSDKLTNTLGLCRTFTTL